MKHVLLNLVYDLIAGSTHGHLIQFLVKRFSLMRHPPLEGEKADENKCVLLLLECVK